MLSDSDASPRGYPERIGRYELLAAHRRGSSAETLSYSPQVSKSGVHHYWARVLAPFAAQDLPTGSGWKWVKLKNLDTFQVQPGTVTVKIKNCEQGTYLDRLFITNDANQAP